MKNQFVSYKFRVPFQILMVYNHNYYIQNKGSDHQY